MYGPIPNQESMTDTPWNPCPISSASMFWLSPIIFYFHVLLTPWAAVCPEVSGVFMYELGAGRDDLRASKHLILATMQFKWFDHLLQCSRHLIITELLSTTGTFVEYPCFTTWTECVSIVALQEWKLYFKQQPKTFGFPRWARRYYLHISKSKEKIRKDPVCFDGKNFPDKISVFLWNKVKRIK